MTASVFGESDLGGVSLRASSRFRAHKCQLSWYMRGYRRRHRGRHILRGTEILVEIEADAGASPPRGVGSLQASLNEGSCLFRGEI